MAKRSSIGKVIKGDFEGKDIFVGSGEFGSGYYFVITDNTYGSIGLFTSYKALKKIDGSTVEKYQDVGTENVGPNTDAMATGTLLFGIGAGLLAGAASQGRSTHTLALYFTTGERSLIKMGSSSAYQKLIEMLFQIDEDNNAPRLTSTETSMRDGRVTVTEELGHTDEMPAFSSFNVISEDETLFFQKGVPLVIEKTVLASDPAKGELYVQFLFRSLSKKRIKHILIDVLCKDVWGNEVQGVQGFQYLDLTVKRDSVFGQMVKIQLPNNNARNVKAIIRKIQYDDGTIVDCSDESITLPKPQTLMDYLGKDELVKEFKRISTEQSDYTLAESVDYWRCSCGGINANDEKNCFRCNMKKHKLIELMKPDYLSNSYVEHQAQLEEDRREKDKAVERELKEREAKAERERREREAEAERERKEREAKAEADRLAAEKAKKKAKKIASIILSVFIVMVAFAVVLVTIIIPNAKYKEALALTENKDYDAAYTHFISLGKFKDSESLAEEALQLKNYDKSLEYIENGEFDFADSLLAGLGDFKDSETLLLETRHAKALSLLKKEKYDEAYNLLSDLGEYKDSSALILDNKYERALALLETEDYEEAYVILQELGNYKGSDTIILENMYERALALAEKEQYEEAIQLLAQLGDFKDSEDLILEYKYEHAGIFIDAKQYKEAYTLLSELEDFKDSRELILPVTYEYALLHTREGNYSVASNLFKELGDYKDSLDQLLFAEAHARNNIGTIVKFGLYEQDNNLSNGKEEIEWQIIAKEGNKVLVISKYILEKLPYHESDEAVTWETSTLRRWLNSTFINTAFSDTQRANIQTTTLTNLGNPIYGTSGGNTTKDKIYILSVSELENYFTEEIYPSVYKTKYVSGGSVEYTGSWWVRTPGKLQNSATHACRPNDAEYDEVGYWTTDSSGVRPAMWIDILGLD